jgi:iron(III) transport system ATP-binding protein
MRVSQVRIERITKRFGTVSVLRDISLVVKESSFVSLLGPSGCGKTTLLRLIAGLEEAGGGTISIGDRVVSDPGRAVHVPPSSRNIGMVFQSYALWPHKTVWENVAHPLRVRKVRKQELAERVMDTLRLVRLESLGDRLPGELSGGQQQRVALGRAIVYQPDLLLLDEPLSNLDAKLRTEMRYEIRELQRRKRLTTVYVTHDQEEAFAISDQICLMNGGAIEQLGQGLDLYESPSTRFVAEFVGAANQLDGQVTAIGEANCFGVAVSSWHFNVRSAHHFDVGAKVSLLMRPHSVRLENKTALNLDSAEGCVMSVVYLGGVTEYELSIVERRLRVRELGPPRFAPGQIVTASLGDYQAIALPRFNT